ncbi:MAG: hypothetical protein V1761_05945 [bacterium]
MVKRIMADVLLGILLLIVMSLVQLLISTLFNADGETSEMVNLLFFVSAVPAGIITFIAAHLTRQPSQSAAWVAAAVLTGIHLVFNLLVGFGNETAGVIFGSIGFYVYTLLYFCGPMVYVIVRKLPRTLPDFHHTAIAKEGKNE